MSTNPTTMVLRIEFRDRDTAQGFLGVLEAGVEKSLVEMFTVLTIDGVAQEHGDHRTSHEDVLARHIAGHERHLHMV